MGHSVSETRNIVTIRVGPFRLCFDRVIREGGVEILKEVLEAIKQSKSDKRKGEQMDPNSSDAQEENLQGWIKECNALRAKLSEAEKELAFFKGPESDYAGAATERSLRKEIAGLEQKWEKAVSEYETVGMELVKKTLECQARASTVMVLKEARTLCWDVVKHTGGRDVDKAWWLLNEALALTEEEK